MIRLLHHPLSPFSQKVRLVLAEKDLDFELQVIDLGKGEQRSAEFRKYNPNMKVPVLIDDDVVVYESTIINEYLEEEYPSPSLMPGDSGARARVRILEDLADTAFIPRSNLLAAELAKPEGERDADRIKRLQEEMIQIVRYLDSQLTNKEYLLGEFSLADIAFAPRALILANLGITLDDQTPNVTNWVARLRERSSVQSLGL